MDPKITGERLGTAAYSTFRAAILLTLTMACWAVLIWLMEGLFPTLAEPIGWRFLPEVVASKSSATVAATMLVTWQWIP